MNNDNEIPDDINIHKKTWGKNAEEVIYGERGVGDDNNGVCPFCNSRIDEFGYCACGGNLGVD
jgi:hypothetical protein